MPKLRDYRLFELSWAGQREIVHYDGDDNRRFTGEFEEVTGLYRIVARSEDLARANLAEHFKYSNVKEVQVRNVERKEIHAIEFVYIE